MTSLLFTEPVGSRAPTFQSEFSGNLLRKPSGQSFALLCSAQAFPVPLIRLVASETKIISPTPHLFYFSQVIRADLYRHFYFYNRTITLLMKGRENSILFSNF